LWLPTYYSCNWNMAASIFFFGQVFWEMVHLYFSELTSLYTMVKDQWCPHLLRSRIFFVYLQLADWNLNYICSVHIFIKIAVISYFYPVWEHIFQSDINCFFRFWSSCRCLSYNRGFNLSRLEKPRLSLLSR